MLDNICTEIFHAIFLCWGSLPMTEQARNDSASTAELCGLCLLYGQFLNEERHFNYSQ